MGGGLQWESLSSPPTRRVRGCAMAKRKTYLPTWRAPPRWWWAPRPSAGRPDRPPPSSPHLEGRHGTDMIQNQHSANWAVRMSVVPEGRCDIASLQASAAKDKGFFFLWGDGRAEGPAECEFCTLLVVIKTKGLQGGREPIAGSASRVGLHSTNHWVKGVKKCWS